MIGIKLGRRPSTSRAVLEHVALDLFAERGFEATTVDDIAAAAGISRRTFFRYYPSKNDVVWGDFDRELEKMSNWLKECPPEQPVMQSLHEATLAFNALDPGQVATHRLRMSLILHVPALQAHSTLRYADWRHVVATFVAQRCEVPVDSLMPQVVSHVLLGAAVAAYEQWLASELNALDELLDASISFVTRNLDLDR